MAGPLVSPVNASATAKALDYGLKRWIALPRYLDGGAVSIDNNQVENQIRPWAFWRSNWLFAWPLRSGKRAPATMSLIQSARMNEQDPYAYAAKSKCRTPVVAVKLFIAFLPRHFARLYVFVE